MRTLLWVALISLISPLHAAAQNKDLFDGLDAWELVRGVVLQTTCEIEGIHEVAGESYCFASRESLEAFSRDLQNNVTRAIAAYNQLTAKADAEEGRLPYPELPLPLQGKTLYVNTFPSGVLYTVNQASAAARLVGSMRRNQVTDVAFRGASLYGITFSSFLKVNPTTGASTIVRDVGVNMDDLNALTYHPSGQFYAAGASGRVVRINPTTGQGTFIGTYGPGIGSSGDLAVGPGGVLYATVKRFGSGNDFLATVNRSTGRATIRGNIGFSNVYGLSFRSGVLFGVTSAGRLLRINTGNGVGTLIGQSRKPLGGMTTSP